MSLYNQYIEPTIWLLRKQKVIVTIYRSRMDLLIISREQNLVVVTIHYQAIRDFVLHIVCATVIVNN